MYPLVLPINKQATTSIPDLSAMRKNLLYSGMLCPVLPSAMFKTIESAALFICDERL
jgi:hypothetical protein